MCTRKRSGPPLRYLVADLRNSSECFPLSHREIGNGFAIFINNSLTTVLSLTYPSLLAAFKPTGGESYREDAPDWCSIWLLCRPKPACLCYNLLFPPRDQVSDPSTQYSADIGRQRTLEELDYIFAVPTKRHAQYQIRTWLPWWIKRYVFWDRKAQLEPLYHLDGVVGTTMPPPPIGHA